MVPPPPPQDEGLPRESDEEDEDRYRDEYEDDVSEDELKFGERPSTTTKKVGPTGLPLEVLKAAEPGLEGGDFRRKLRKARDTKINTAAAFPEAKANPEQVDFRNVLKKVSASDKRDVKGGSEEQADFRSLKKSKVCLQCET